MSTREKQVVALVTRAEGQLANARKNYVKASHLAMVEFAESGNLGPCQRILDSLNDKSRSGVVKRSGYLTYLTAFAPITHPKNDSGVLDVKKLVKDKSKNAVELDLEGALKADFFDLSANNDEEHVFQSDDMWKAILRVVNKYSSDKEKPADNAATEALSKAKKFIKTNRPDLEVA